MNMEYSVLCVCVSIFVKIFHRQRSQLFFEACVALKKRRKIVVYLLFWLYCKQIDKCAHCVDIFRYIFCIYASAMIYS